MTATQRIRTHCSQPHAAARAARGASRKHGLCLEVAPCYRGCPGGHADVTVIRPARHPVIELHDNSFFVIGSLRGLLGPTESALVIVPALDKSRSRETALFPNLVHGTHFMRRDMARETLEVTLSSRKFERN